MPSLCEEARAAGRYCYVTTYHDGVTPIKTSLLFRTSEQAEECARRLRGAFGDAVPTPSEPPAGSTATAHVWIKPTMEGGWSCTIRARGREDVACCKSAVVFCEEDHGNGTCLEGRCREHAPAGSTQGVPEGVCPTCKGSREVLSFYARGPGDPPGNAMVQCPTCRPRAPGSFNRSVESFAADLAEIYSRQQRNDSRPPHNATAARVPEGKPAGTFVSQPCKRCNDEGWISVADGEALFGTHPERCPVGCPDEIERAGRTPSGEGR